jgi:hypothetical protein
MLSDDITLAGDASSSQMYSFQNYPTPTSSLRGDKVAGSVLPRTMSIAHSVSKKGTLSTERHVVRLNLSKANAVTGEKVTGSVYVVFERPLDDAVTVAHYKDMFTQLKALLTAGAIEQVLNGES